MSHLSSGVAAGADPQPGRRKGASEAARAVPALFTRLNSGRIAGASLKVSVARRQVCWRGLRLERAQRARRLEGARVKVPARDTGQNTDTAQGAHFPIGKDGAIITSGARGARQPASSRSAVETSPRALAGEGGRRHVHDGRVTFPTPFKWEVVLRGHDVQRGGRVPANRLGARGV